MMQEVIIYIIGALAAMYIIWSLVRFAHRVKHKKNICGSCTKCDGGGKPSSDCGDKRTSDCDGSRK